MTSYTIVWFVIVAVFLSSLMSMSKKIYSKLFCFALATLLLSIVFKFLGFNWFSLLLVLFACFLSMLTMGVSFVFEAKGKFFNFFIGIFSFLLLFKLFLANKMYSLILFGDDVLLFSTNSNNTLISQMLVPMFSLYLPVVAIIVLLFFSFLFCSIVFLNCKEE